MVLVLEVSYNVKFHRDAQEHQGKGLAANDNASWEYGAPAGTQMCISGFLQGG